MIRFDNLTYEEFMKNRVKTRFRGSFPACTDRKAYANWVEVARVVVPPHETGFCTDCTPEYQKEMIEQGRCENPEVVFVVEDGMVEGRMRLPERPVDKPEKV